MSKIRVGIVRGGSGLASEYSIKSGGEVLNIIREKLNSRFEPVDIFVDTDGIWNIAGRAISPESLMHKVDILFNLIHDEGDASVSGVARALGIPYIGSPAFGSAFSSNKALAKERIKALGIKTPPACLVTLSQNPDEEELAKVAREVLANIPPPWVVKPNHGACALHVQIARSLPELMLAFAHQNQKHNMSLLVETYLYGREFHFGIVEGLRGGGNYHTMPVEIIKNEKLFSSEARASGDYRIIPARISKAERKEFSDIANLVHKDLGLSHFSGFDFILTNRGTHLVEVNDVPELHSESVFNKALAESGVPLHELIEHLLDRAVRLK